MVEGIAGALGGAAAAENAQTTGNGNPASGKMGGKHGTFQVPVTTMSEYPSVAMGMSLGNVLASGMLENNPKWKAAFEGHEEDLAQLMQTLMSEVTRKAGKSLDFLKEKDDEEDRCAATEMYKP
jgi:hypothetical protein